MNKALTCVIIEDEFLAAELLKKYVAQTDDVVLLHCFDNPAVALDFLNGTKVDFVLLDVQMPQMKGTEVASKIMDKVQIIFTTAYSDYAVESYTYRAADYLMKPIRYERFLEAVNKVKNRISATRPSADQTITVKSGHDTIKLKLGEIRYVQAMREYVAFHTAKGRVWNHFPSKG